MSLLGSIKDHHAEKGLFVRRAILAGTIALTLLLIVIARLVQLQVVDYEHFAERSQGNLFRIEPLSPTRGLIFDRKGRVLAENLPVYQLELIPEQVADLDATLRGLAAENLVAEADIPQFLQLAKAGPRFKPVTLNFRLSEDQIANFAIKRPRFPGVDFQPRLVRHYPQGAVTAHAIGYVAAISTDDLARLNPSDYVGTTHTGKTGVEYSYEATLHGEPGFRQVVTNARGRQIPLAPGTGATSFAEKREPSPGENVHLTIDLDLQVTATEALAGRRGAVVAIDTRTGEILAFVSAPSFDPNQFPLGMSQTQYGELENNLDRPLFNRAVRGQYPPGSTIKPILSLAALETGATTNKRRMVCPGFFMLPGSTHRYRDWKPEGHGEVDLHEAITQSCDVYFYRISSDIGIDAIHDYLTLFGLGSNTGIDIEGEKPGLVPSKAWKRQAFRRREDQVWFPGETVIASIGQGYMLATPTQLASAVATVAMRGKRVTPRMVRAVENPLTGIRTELPFRKLDDVVLRDPQHWEQVIAAMHDVMQGARGTARAAGARASYRMAGKSGTAQVFSVAQEEEYDEDEVDERLKDHALFISFAPLDDPAIAVAVIVENGSSGSTFAAPIARAVMDKYLEDSQSAL